MIIECPNCQTKYNLPDEKLKPGKKLRCAKCTNSWLFMNDEAQKPEDVKQSVIEEEKKQKLHSEGPEEAEIGKKEESTIDDFSRVSKIIPLKKPDDVTEQKLPWILKFLPVPMVTFTIILTFFAYADKIGFENIFEKIGLMTSHKVIINKVEIIEIAKSDKGYDVEVRGDIKNIVKEVQLLPLLKLSVLDESGKALASSEYKLSEESNELNPEEIFTFKTKIYSLSDKIKYIRIVIGDKYQVKFR